jgi:biotin/methionine sulfoxide reductase
MISVSWSLTRQDHGEQPFWMAIMLASMVGQIGLPGGGFGFGYSATNFIGGQFTILPGAAFPQTKNEIENFIPVARISDLLLHPGEKFDFDGKSYEYPNTKIVYWAGGNPFHHHQDLNRLIEAWEKPDTIISNEWCWNTLAKRSDIVLPCTTPLERNDIMMTPRDPYVVSMSKLIEPYKQARDDYEIFSNIAKRMGVEDKFTEGRNQEEWQKWIYSETYRKAESANIELPSYEKFRENKWFKIKDPSKPTLMLKEFIEDPLKNPLNTPSGKIEIYSKTVAEFNYDDCPGHPVWLEPCEWLGKKNKTFPLHLISNQPKNKLHSQMDHGKYSKSFKIKDREPLKINPNDAKKRGLKNGDVVKLFNGRGACLAGVIIDKKVMEGVVQISTGAWYDPEDPKKPNSICKHGNPNVLTIDKGSSKLGQGPIAHSCLVEMKKFNDNLPTVTAHKPPTILRNKSNIN